MKTHSDVLCRRLDELSDAIAAGPFTVVHGFRIRLTIEVAGDTDLTLSEAAQRIRELESALSFIRNETLAPDDRLYLHDIANNALKEPTNES